jgi:hypothetical protein
MSKEFVARQGTRVVGRLAVMICLVFHNAASPQLGVDKSRENISLLD